MPPTDYNPIDSPDGSRNDTQTTDIAVPHLQDGKLEFRPPEKSIDTLAQEREERRQSQASTERAPRLTDRSCNHEEHDNPKCICHTPDEERAELLREYLQVLAESGWKHPRLMPVNRQKEPVIKRSCRLESPQAYDLLHSPEEAIDAIRDGAVGFCLYADKPGHNTEGLVFADRDEPHQWPDLGKTLRVLSGSGTGDHLTFISAGDIECAKGKGDLAGIGSVRGMNLFVNVPGSIHPSGGIYHMVENPGIAELSPEDLPRELQPGSLTKSNASGESETYAPLESLPDEFTPGDVTNDVGMTLREVRRLSNRTDTLLSRIHPSGYESPSESDQAAVRSLLIWRFDETDIAHILRSCRDRRGRVGEDDHPYKLERDEYVRRTIRNTTIPYEVDPALAQALLNDARETDGRRPSAGCLSLIEVQEAFAHLGGEATVTQLVESGYVTWRGAEKESVKRRVRRCLSILQDAGYVSSRAHPQDRRKKLYAADGLKQLQIPGDTEWNQATHSLKKQEAANRDTEGSSHVSE